MDLKSNLSFIFLGYVAVVVVFSRYGEALSPSCDLEELTSISSPCVSDDGKPVDWYVASKFPKQVENTRFSLLSSGERYVFIDSSMDASQTWIISPKNISAKSSILGFTTLPLFPQDNKFNRNAEARLSYVVYNDQPPDSATSASMGHTKGILAIGEEKGFWLIHSIPKFPEKEDTFSYPDTGKEFGQSMLCITVNTSQINNIAFQLLYMKPNILKFQLTRQIQQIAPQLTKLVQGKFIRTRPWNHTAVIYSDKGNPFVSFSKHPSAKVELYSEIVAPSVKSNLFTETWKRGSGGSLKPVCDAAYTVEDIEKMSIEFSMDGTRRRRKWRNFQYDGHEAEYSSMNDHSKVAFSSDAKPARPWACVGDINRMKSQRSRGGGTVCFSFAENVWKAYKNSVAEVEDCPLKAEGRQI